MTRPHVRRLLGVAGLAAALALPGCRLTTNDLIGAVVANDLKRAQRCLDAGVDVNEPSRYGFKLENEGDTPLDAAVQYASPTSSVRAWDRRRSRSRT